MPGGGGAGIVGAHQTRRKVEAEARQAGLGDEEAEGDLDGLTNWAGLH